MKFSSRQDIEAPIDFVFKEVSDFDAIERQMLRRGVKVQCTDQGDARGVGRSWAAKMAFRGKSRNVAAELTQVEKPNGYSIVSASGGINMHLDVDLVALSRNRTRVAVAVDVKPSSLSARLLVQSMKFAKTNLQKRFDSRVASFATEIKERYARA